MPNSYSCWESINSSGFLNLIKRIGYGMVQSMLKDSNNYSINLLVQRMVQSMLHLNG